MNDKIQNFILELLQYHEELKEYKNLLITIANEIVSNNISLSLRTDGGPNLYHIDSHGKHSIKISIGIKRIKPLSVIWDILHEYGHFLSGRKTEGQSETFRENLAWDIASQKFKHFEISEHLYHDFEVFRNKSLEV